jgi:hypothetical protein
VFTLPVGAQTINPGIIDPTNSYAGKTYSEWAAAWWQHYMSLPATNNPFVYDPPYPACPLSTGQSGPVWFICGNYANGGVHSFTYTIPGGVGLFMPITDIEQDNAGCPTTNNYTLHQLEAYAVTTQNNATNMTCTIDGVAVIGISNVLTTPYRVLSPAFAYTCPPVHNVLHDLFGLSCYQNFSGMPYTIPVAVEDGVFLLVAPLSAGAHVIDTACAFPTFNPPFYANFTYHLTVQPVALTVTTASQPQSLVLTWPQTPDTYHLELSPDLGSSSWQTSNLPVLLSNQTYQVTAPIGTANQFFRLRLN